MIVWDVEIQEVGSKDVADYWENLGTYTVVAGDIREAIQKTLCLVKKENPDIFKLRAVKATLVREVDIE